MKQYLLSVYQPDGPAPPAETLALISRRLKFLARDLNIPVVALAQVNRQSEDRQDHKPRLADLRESGSIEQDADVCMILHRPDMYVSKDEQERKSPKPCEVLEIHVLKQRNGPTGQLSLTFHKQFMRYENWAPGDDFEYGQQPATTEYRALD